jgi:hypothetical protein
MACPAYLIIVLAILMVVYYLIVDGFSSMTFTAGKVL